MELLLAVYAFIIGLCFGSFTLATAWRLKKKKRFGGRERSVCEHCRHTLKVADLMPLFSWLTLRGRCRYCHKKLSPVLPLAELLGGLLFLVSYLYWPERLGGVYGIAMFGTWLVGLVLLLILFFYDIQWYILPNKVIYPLWAVAGVNFLVRVLHQQTFRSVWMGALAVAVGAGIFWLLFEISKGKWIGFGDVRLGVAIGLFTGSPLLAALVIFLASLLGVIAALPGLVKRSLSLNSKLPFGPLLIIALVLVRLFGDRAVDWYAAHLLFV